jgi:hypothetical protein
MYDVFDAINLGLLYRDVNETERRLPESFTKASVEMVFMSITTVLPTLISPMISLVVNLHEVIFLSFKFKLPLRVEGLISSFYLFTHLKRKLCSYRAPHFPPPACGPAPRWAGPGCARGDTMGWGWGWRVCVYIGVWRGKDAAWRG